MHKEGEGRAGRAKAGPHQRRPRPAGYRDAAKTCQKAQGTGRLQRPPAARCSRPRRRRQLLRGRRGQPARQPMSQTTWLRRQHSGRAMQRRTHSALLLCSSASMCSALRHGNSASWVWERAARAVRESTQGHGNSQVHQYRSGYEMPQRRQLMRGFAQRANACAHQDPSIQRSRRAPVHMSRVHGRSERRGPLRPATGVRLGNL